MKTTAKMIAIVILLGAGSWLMTEKAQAHGWAHYEVFYHELSPYGTWIDSPEYGYVWIPNVAPGFHPYGTSGYWANTIYGWTWVSFYPWGWAPFHYGRWYYDDWYGWAWVPGNEWGPAWVSWRHCDGYYGWAPLTPGFHFPMSFNMHINVPVNHWVFVPGRHFGERYQERYHMGRWDNDRLYHRSNPIVTTSVDNERNTRFFSGPEVREIRKETGRDFKPVAVSEKNNAGQTIRNERMEIYRPKVDGNAVRAEKTRLVEKYAPSPERNMRSEKPPQYSRKPADRVMQADKNTRQGNTINKNERPNRQPSQRHYSDQEKYSKRGELAERKTLAPNQNAGQNHKVENRSNVIHGNDRHQK
jgi:hypothetical protein